MKKFFVLAVFLFAVMISSTALAANWFLVNSGEYGDVYVDKDSIQYESTYSPNGFRTDIKLIIKGFANAGDYEIWTHHYKEEDGILYYFPEFLSHYNPDGNEDNSHVDRSFWEEPSWYEITGYEIKVCEYVQNNLP